MSAKDELVELNQEMIALERKLAVLKSKQSDIRKTFQKYNIKTSKDAAKLIKKFEMELEEKQDEREKLSNSIEKTLRSIRES